MNQADRSMDILLIHRAFATQNEPGGTRHFTLGRELVRRGHRFRVIGSRQSYLTGKAHGSSENSGSRKETIAGVEVYRTSTYEGIGRGPWKRALRLLSFSKNALVEAFRHEPPDVILGTTPGLDQGLVSCIVAKIRRVPFVLEVRDLWPDFLIEMEVISNRIVIGAMRLVERLLYRTADRVIVNSPAYVEHVASARGDRGAIDFVPNGVDVGLFRKSAELDEGENRPLTDGVENEFTVVYMGNHGPSNALGTLLDAADRLRSRQEIEIVLIGGGSSKEKLVQEARERELTNVCFEPACPKQEVPHRLSEADACVATLMDIPMFRLTYPNKVFDYMAAGKPTILAIEGVIQEVVEAADGGICVTPEAPGELVDAIIELYENPDWASQLGENARSYVEEHFDWSNIAPDLESSLLRAVNRKFGKVESARK